jgi:hypothetical protein
LYRARKHYTRNTELLNNSSTTAGKKKHNLRRTTLQTLQTALEIPQCTPKCVIGMDALVDFKNYIENL